MKNKIVGSILFLSVAMVGNAAEIGTSFDSSEKKGTISFPGQDASVEIFEHVGADGDREILLRVPKEISTMELRGSEGAGRTPYKRQFFEYNSPEFLKEPKSNSL